ncbi:protein unc-79 homolog isoform X3 [Neocloeon triangulifer]|uniref:protein unc-79 homolog isoform X3 n=1 Tax=Neocloeon triangulifer TaxID=2078957 RepID=UPI00286F7F21|nr:protein unc-79 homolog isoform X3 [Neocloeon triangulifer]
MATRVAAFTAKIRNLHDFQLRLLHGIVPVPSGLDIANTIKSFSQILLCVLKDVPYSPLEMLRNCEQDTARMALFPNLDYKGLYNAIVQLMDVAPLIQYGLHSFGQAVLQCLGCLLSFLDAETIDTLPYLVASSMAVLPDTLHQEIVNCLCFYILPFTITRKPQSEEEDRQHQHLQIEETYASQSVSAILMMVFQFSNNSAHHCQLLECLMSMKPGVVKDLLCIVAYGTAGARASAAKLLFYYWPPFNINAIEKRTPTHQVRLAADWPPLLCQRDSCPNTGTAEAAKVCFDHGASITFANEKPPPLYLCIECANEIHRCSANLSFHDVIHPMQQVALFCESKSCRSSDKQAVSVCFSMECASYNTNHPIRHCRSCHQSRHNNRRGYDHVYHTALTSAWKMEVEVQTFLIESIVSLLQEASNAGSIPESSSVKEGLQMLNVQSNLMDLHASKSAGTLSVNSSQTLDTVEDKLMMSRHGVWLLVSLCWPSAESDSETIGRLISMLCNWYAATAYISDHLESPSEKLKTEHVAPWIAAVIENHPQILVSCLLPHPPEYARMGGHWETLSGKSSHLKAGLNRLLCLVPYEVVTPEIWDQVMPHWMEALVSDSNANSSQRFGINSTMNTEVASQISILLSKLLDPEMSPLGFDSKTMYNFLIVRFSRTSASVQKQTLTWIQFLTSLEIVVQINILMKMFGEGVRTMKVANPEDAKYLRKPSNLEKLSSLQDNGSRKTSISPVVEDDSDQNSPLSEDEGPANNASSENGFQSDPELNLSCCIMMLDILLKQMQLQSMERHSGIWGALATDICRLLRNMIISPWVTSHRCDEKRGEECLFCESRVIWHQMALNLVTYIAPDLPQQQPESEIEVFSSEDIEKGKNKSSPDSEKKQEMRPSDVVITMPLPETHTVGNVLVNMPQLFVSDSWISSQVRTIMTATVETVSEQLDLAPIIPSERVVPAIARAVTITDTDVATATVHVQKATLVGENDQPIDIDQPADNREFWKTSVGKFWFSFGDLPDQLQYCHQLLKELPTTTEPDVLYHILQSLHILLLHGDALVKASRDHRGFLIWCQENLLIENLWNLLNAEHGHICEICVPVLLHCITLPCGLDVFWNVVQKAFHHQDWKQRFTAVERVTVIARFLDSTPLRNQQALQSALANAFCYLISSMDDINVQVAQRATLFIGTVHDRAIKSLVTCLESQFDSVIVDRPMVLQSLYQLHNSMSDRHILSWDFFLNRFDTLFIEAQINAEKCGDITYLRDLRNSDLNSETFLRKLNRAHEALSQSDTSNSGGSAQGPSQADSPTSSAAANVPHQPPPLIKTLSASFGTKWPYKRTMSAPAQMLPRADKTGSTNVIDKEKVYNRQFSAPVLKRRSSGRFGLEGQMHTSNIMEDVQVCGLLQRIIEFEESDSETIHLLVFLLMQFMSRPDQAFPTDDKNIAKVQNIVLRHMYLLLGYNWSERGFYVSAQKLRNSAIFRVFMANLPQLLDHNHLLGLLTLPTVLTLLIYCPSSQHYSSTFVGNHEILSNSSNYTLWLLEPQIRRNWFISLLVILYKYQFNQPLFYNQLQYLIRIVLNTLDAQQHYCRRIPGTLVIGSLPSRSRDVSQPSLGNACGDVSMDNACESPTMPQMQDHSGAIARPAKFVTNSMETHWEEDIQVHQAADEMENGKRQPSSFEADDTESELAAIPESPQSGSTIHQSLHGSFEELVSCTVVEEARVSVVEQPAVATVVISRANVVVSEKPRFGKEQPRTISIEPTWATAEVCQAATVVHSSPRSTTKPFRVSQQHSIRSEDYFFGSPDSPLSKMEVQTISSPIEVKEADFSLLSSLEIPNQERLLPIGSSRETVYNFADKMKTCLHLSDIEPSTSRPKDLESKVEKQDSRSSPRILKKQTALVESPPHMYTSPFAQATSSKVEEHVSDEGTHLHKNWHHHDRKHREEKGRPRSRKGGLFSVAATQATSHTVRPAGSWHPGTQGAEGQPDLNNEGGAKWTEDQVLERCSECGLTIEEYTPEDVGLCIIILGTFMHGEPNLAAPMLPEILRIVSKVSQNAPFYWQNDSKTHLPGSTVSVANQFLRCVLHQLAPNGIFTQIFQTQVPEQMKLQFFRSVAQALLDFTDLNPVQPLQLLLESLNSKKTLPVEMVPNTGHNIALYLECLQPLDTGIGSSSQTWSQLLTAMESFFRRIALTLPLIDNVEPLLRLMIQTLKLPGTSGCKGILEPFSKVLSFGVQNFNLKYQQLADLCYHCSRAFVRERERLLLTRVLVLELVQALKFKSNIPDINFFLLVNFILEDAGGLLMTTGMEQYLGVNSELLSGPPINTNACECMRQHINDAIEFLTDVHTLSRIKSNCKGVSVGLNDDTLGGFIKSGIAQYMALEITRGNNRDNRAVSRYLPWLCNVPTTIQQGPREFLECMGHIRLLSWLLLGSLYHTALIGPSKPQPGVGPNSSSQSGSITCQPIPQEVSCHVADHIQVILAGFVEQSKASVLHMSSLFHAFILSQLWTMYLEQGPSSNMANAEAHNVTMTILFDFWCKVTPCILQLVSHSKVLAEMVNLHFLSLLEALLECNSTVLSKLLPLWCPVLYSHQNQLPGHLQVRLQSCRNYAPNDSFQTEAPPPSGPQSTAPGSSQSPSHSAILNQAKQNPSATPKKVKAANPFLLKWLQRLQFKMGQIELQSSAATQFYSV